jgi:hypothetical protein
VRNDFEGLNIIKSSLFTDNDAAYALFQDGGDLKLAILETEVGDWQGEHIPKNTHSLVIAPKTPHNTALLRKRLPWLNPGLLGLRTSAGMGDRLGWATPGHIRAVRSVGGKIAPIFAQQSIREMNRTGRTAQQVVDDAVWGIFQESWQDGFGADADHLKTEADIDTCLQAGFTFYTIDPGEHVDNRAEDASLSTLRELAALLNEDVSPEASGLLGKSINIEGHKLVFNEAQLLKAAVKYGKAVAHVARMYHHLIDRAGSHPVELEVSVDETEQPTSMLEHAYIASELKRLGVNWVSLAPRYCGHFPKGVDYIGDPQAFEADIARHAAVARHFGPYKLSLHSGSDKFSVYEAAMRQTHGLVHLKTAGTSYLEALRTIAEQDVNFFKEIYRFARERYTVDRVSYDVFGELKNAPHPEQVTNWPALLDQFDARQILHVTFGSVLNERDPEGHFRFYSDFARIIKSNRERYASNLERHFIKHLQPFAKPLA